MSQSEYPNKELVRAWLKNEVAMHRPPPDIKQIRRELGWDLVQEVGRFNTSKQVDRLHH